MLRERLLIRSNGVARGFSIIEVILGMAIFALLMTALVGVFIFGRETIMLSGPRARAVLLAEEGLEIVKNIGQNDFAGLVAGPHGLTVSAVGNYWILAGTSDAIDGFVRQISITDVDSYRKDITSTITWNQTAARTGTVTLTTRLTNWRALAAGDWSSPALASSFDLTLLNSGSVAADGISIAFANNYVYLSRANSALGNEFYIFDATNPASPQLVGQRALNGDPNDIVVRGNYAYIASSNNSAELQILDISDPTAIGAGGKLKATNLTNGNSNNNNADAIALAVDNDYLYMVRAGGDELLIFDLQANPDNPGAPIGRQGALTGVPTDIVVFNDYVYITSNDDNAELWIFNTTTKTAPTLSTSVNVNSGNDAANGMALAVGNNNHLYLGRESSAAPELYDFNISNPGTASLISTLEIGADIRSMSLAASTGYIFMATSSTTTDFKVVNTNTMSMAPVILGQLDINNSPSAIVYNSILDRAFIASSADTQELQVIKPQ
ncbi:MAG: prepilin-type N-terminal cleavage/methylation domain-containing protein [Patescibacteria group bacterium]